MYNLLRKLLADNFSKFVDLVENSNSKLDLNEQDDDGKTLLMFAAELGRIDALDFLIQKGCDISIVCKSDMNCIHYSLLGDNENAENVLRRLIIYNADFSQRSVNGTPLSLATKSGLNGCVSLIIKYFPGLVNSEPLIYYAIQTKHFDLARKLIEIDEIDVDLRAGQRQQTALHLAAAMSEVELVTALLKKSKVNIEDDTGKTCLHLAAENGVFKIIKRLVDAGLDVNKQDSTLWKFTPLHQASQRGFVETVEELLENGANVDVLDGDNRTPLILAIIACQPLTALRLVQEGCNVNACVSGTIMNISDKPVHALDLARALQFEPIVDLLVEAGATSVFRQVVPTLLCLSANKLRQALKPKVRKKINLQPLPYPIKRKLLFYDLHSAFKTIEHEP
ncbi:unnamed protein product [Dimorphilus gyrociliatus]|uniref:Uncharacterized protein n=1 Tax=Dimorphilus gyrociliatus TaxID=2664684 RepID=A0A7I8VRT6_9ANNE|nr:unnamed protein product [Dimorphilus gyrociliatus]